MTHALLQKRGELRTADHLIQDVPTPNQILAKSFFDSYRRSSRPVGDHVIAFHDTQADVPGMVGAA